MSYAPRQKNRITRTGDPFTFRERLEKMWSEAPSTTVMQAMKLTGAPKAACTTVRRRLIASGKLKASPRDKERVW